MQTLGPLEIQKLAVGACGRVANGRRDPKADTPMWMRNQETLDQGQADGSLAPEAAVKGFHSRRERRKIARVLLTVKEPQISSRFPERVCLGPDPTRLAGRSPRPAKVRPATSLLSSMPLSKDDQGYSSTGPS
jgi:hypothetical protein